MRKRITALVLEGDAVALLDNIPSGRKLELPSLDALLTSMVWKDRSLGSNTSITGPARAIWWTTGNNLAFGGDLTRRTIHIRLESPLENPEERADLKHADLIAWVGRERKRLVASALTILRAYFYAGAPDQKTGMLGGFDEWSRIVPHALVWCGAANPIDARATTDSALDDEKRAIRTLILGLRKLCAPRALTAKEIVVTLYPGDGTTRTGPPDGYDELRDAIEQETRALPGHKPEPRRLGKWLSRCRGRVVGGWMVKRDEEDGHAATWGAVAAS